MEKFRFSRYPESAINRALILFPDGGSLRYVSDVNFGAFWIEVLEAGDLALGGHVRTGDLVRVIPSSPANYRSNGNDVAFITLKDNAFKNDGKEVYIHCCRIETKQKVSFIMSTISQPEKTFEIYFNQIDRIYSFAELRRKDLFWQKHGSPQTFDEIRNRYFKKE